MVAGPGIVFEASSRRFFEMIRIGRTMWLFGHYVKVCREGISCAALWPHFAASAAGRILPARRLSIRRSAGALRRMRPDQGVHYRQYPAIGESKETRVARL